MPTYYLGLDVHKVRTQYCLVDVFGEILGEGSVPTEEAALLVFDADTAVVLEATGSWHATYDALVATGAHVKLAHPARIKAIASAKVKTDKIDARILAHLLRADLIPEAWAPPLHVRELRDLVRLRTNRPRRLLSVEQSTRRLGQGNLGSPGRRIRFDRAEHQRPRRRPAARGASDHRELPHSTAVEIGRAPRPEQEPCTAGQTHFPHETGQ